MGSKEKIFYQHQKIKYLKRDFKKIKGRTKMKCTFSSDKENNSRKARGVRILPQSTNIMFKRQAASDNWSVTCADWKNLQIR